MDQLRLARRDHQKKEGTLKERAHNGMELYFDRIADDDLDITEVDLVGDKNFLALDEEAKCHSGYTFATNTIIKTIKMELLGLDDNFAEAFGEAIAVNETIKQVNIDSNAIMSEPMKNRTAGEMIRAYQALMLRLKAAGIKDNECSEEYKQAIKENGIEYELVF